MGLVFVLHGFFLLGIRNNFQIDRGTKKFVFNALTAAILIFAVSFYSTGTILGVSKLNLYEPLMISILFLFSLSLPVTKASDDLGATET